MAEIGLIYYDVSTFSIEDAPKEIFYYGTRLTLDAPLLLHPFHVGYATFTRSGYELASICKSDPSEEFLEYVLKRWPHVFSNVVRMSTASPGSSTF